MHGLSLPEWVLAATVIALGLGFPITLVLAWVFDVNAGRVETAGPRPRAGLLLHLIAPGVVLGAPGIAWYLVLRPAARAPSAAKDVRATLDAAPPASEARAAPSIAVLPLVNMSKDPDQEYSPTASRRSCSTCSPRSPACASPPAPPPSPSRARTRTWRRSGRSCTSPTFSRAACAGRAIGCASPRS